MFTKPWAPFRTGVLPGSEIISNPHERREYMKRNDLVEYDDGVTNAETWVDERNEDRQRVADLKRFEETDPLNLPPEYKAEYVGDRDLHGASEVDHTAVDTVVE